MCLSKKNTTKTVKKKSTGTTTAKSSGYFPELTTSAGPESDKRTAKEKFDQNPAREESVARKKRKKKKERQRREREERERRAREQAEADAAADAATEAEEEAKPLIESVADVTTAEGSPIGETSVTPASIYQKDPEEAMSEQERLAQEELRRQRIKRARKKQSLLRRRLERSQDLGAGRRVLSGTERELNVQTKQAGSGRRSGAGRRSLITGSTGGIGYYSRFL